MRWNKCQCGTSMNSHFMVFDLVCWSFSEPFSSYISNLSEYQQLKGRSESWSLLVLHNSKYILQTSIQKSKKHHPCLEPVDTHQIRQKLPQYVLEDGPNTKMLSMHPMDSQQFPGRTELLVGQGQGLPWRRFNMKNLGATCVSPRPQIIWTSDTIFLTRTFLTFPATQTTAIV